MGRPREHSPVLWIAAAFAREPEALAWARAKAEAVWGPPAFEPLAFEFVETDYYEKTMGAGLTKTFWAFDRTSPPDELPERKLLSNAWEDEATASGRWPQPRPVNVDPGYVTLAKLVLATTKDHAHRLYLGRGVFGETTLAFRGGAWEPQPWTYPDYRRSDVHAFLSRCRDHLKSLRRDSSA